MQADAVERVVLEVTVDAAEGRTAEVHDAHAVRVAEAVRVMLFGD
jgi:hypothetical protein